MQLGVDRTTLSKILNGRAVITPAMALRIERWLGRDHGGAAEFTRTRYVQSRVYHAVQKSI